MQKFVAIVQGVALVLTTSACVSNHIERDDFADFSSESVQPGTSVQRAGAPVQLIAAEDDIANALENIELTDSKWKKGSSLFMVGHHRNLFRYMRLVISVDNFEKT